MDAARPKEQATVDPRVLRTRKDVLFAVVQVLLDEGWEAFGHARVAQVAGYSKATVYAHWPTREALLRDAFSLIGATPHHEPTGDMRRDMLTELLSFRTGMVELRLDRVLAVLSDLTHSIPELVDVRNSLVADGERVVRELLGQHVRGADLEAATLMLCGAVLHSALMHGEPLTDEVVTASVEMVLRGIGGSAVT